MKRWGAKDEDAEGRLELLLALYKLFGSAVKNDDGSFAKRSDGTVYGQFTSVDVKAKLDHASLVGVGTPDDPEIAALRAACMSKGLGTISAKSIGKSLTKNIDAPCSAPDGVITLTSYDPTTNHGRVRLFEITYTIEKGKNKRQA